MTEYIKFKVVPEGGSIDPMTAQQVGDMWYFYSEQGWVTTSAAGDNFLFEKESESSVGSSLDSDTFLKAIAIAQDPKLAKELLT